MPITCPFVVRPISQEEFAQLDYRVMRHAFDSQRQLGRLCDEQVYRNDLVARLVSAGMGRVRTEVPITVAHQDFVKVYRMDLLLDDRAVYELKADASLVPEHEAQLLNYLFLCGASRGKLVNFRPARVESRFLNNPLSPEARWRIEQDFSRWQEPAARASPVKAHPVAGHSVDQSCTAPSPVRHAEQMSRQENGDKMIGVVSILLSPFSCLHRPDGDKDFPYASSARLPIPVGRRRVILRA